MNTTASQVDTERYARCIEASRRVRWHIDNDVIRGRRFDYTQKFLPDGLSRVDRFGFLGENDQRLLSQIQGRTYANIFGLVERYIGAKILEISRDHWLGDQVALESLVRFADEELKHQELFRRIDELCARGMPTGYRFLPDPNEVAAAVLGKSTWAVLALTCHIELFTQSHYKKSIEPDPNLSPLYKDVFLYHWKEESQHAVMDELEWRREDEKLTDAGRDRAVDDFVELVGAIDDVLQLQSGADAEYFQTISQRRFSDTETETIRTGLLQSYRWQYIVSGAEHPRFQQLLGELTSPDQLRRILDALAPLISTIH